MGRAKLTTDEFKKIVSDSTGGEYILIGEYISSKIKTEFFHTKCNKTFLMRPNDFQQGYRCPHCFSDKKKTTEEFKKEVKELVGDEYSVIGEYVNNKTNIKIKHNKCGRIIETTPHTFLRCHSCKYCAGVAKKTTEDFKKEVKKLVGDEYSVIGEYVNTHTKIRMRHNKCGNEYDVTPRKFLLSRRCPQCRESKGEESIRKFCTDNNIEFIRQKTFSECKNKKTLPFDFYITSKNILIEYDGEHHYKPIFGNERFKKTKENDRIKNKFCKNSSITLIRIPYWEFNNIETILKKKLL